MNSEELGDLKRMFKQFSFPGGIPSHVAPETPGSIHEGGELGYALSHAYGAAFDNPDLLVAAVVGDGEAETGPLATSWHSNKFINPATDGVVLPILHLNGYKIANPTVLAGGLLAVTLVVALVWMWQRRHGSALCLVGIGLLHMLPTLVMPLNVLVNDRRAYVPMAMACIGIPALAMRFAPPLPLRAVVVATLLIVAGLSAGRNQVWAEEGTLWSEAVARSPQMPRPHLFHGNAFKDRALHTQDAAQQSALWREAARAYERALRFPSDDDIRLRAHNNLGGIHLTLGNLEEAEQTFRRAIEHGPNYVDALINLGNFFVKKSRLPTSPAQREAWLEEAIGFFRRGLREEPNHFLGHSNLGVVLQDLGRWTEAEQSYRQALFLHPHHYGTLTNLAALLLRKAEQAQEENDRNRFLGDSEHLVRRSLTLNPAQDRAREILRLVTSARTSGGS